MIIQCEECSTRFRLADEKVKPSGTKVRCSKCRHIFTVMPPAPEPPDEEVDFDAMNMEAVAGAEAPGAPSDAGDAATDVPSGPVPDQAPDDSLPDFSSLEQDLPASAANRDELAEDFSFADPDPGDTGRAADPSEEGDLRPASSFANRLPDDAASTFSFDEPGEAAAGQGDIPRDEFSLDTDSEDSDEFDFEDPAETEAPPQDFSFGAPDDADSFDFQEKEPAGEDTDDFGTGEGLDEFSFDDEPAPREGLASEEWQDDAGPADEGFDFDEPAFETKPPLADRTESSDGGLQFGEIDLKSPDDDETPSSDRGEDFSGASLSLSREEHREDPSATPARQRQDSTFRDADSDQLPVPPVKRKGPLSKILLLLVLLLLALAAAAGYFYLQDGSLDLNRITQRFSGETQPTVPEQRIGINITNSTYVSNRHAGQLLVVQGEAVNNFPAARSAIAVKGILLDAGGRQLFQQTVFCGNSLDERTVRQATFAKIEEAMNNQFGDSLSNMNVAAGATIPFTIVFRNLPEGIANINVEVVSSKPASN